jgi:hypothetical protein
MPNKKILRLKKEPREGSFALRHSYRSLKNLEPKREPMSRGRSRIPGFVVITVLSLALPAFAGNSVPFVGTLDATSQVVGETDSGLLILLATGTGQATHLGNYSAALSFDLEPVFPFPFAGMIVFTAANGDRLNAKFTGVYDSATTCAGTLTFVDGGTGRFAKASGTGTLSGQDLGSLFVFSVDIDGRIAFSK